MAQLGLPAHPAAAGLGDPAQQRRDVGDGGDRGVLQAFGLAAASGAEPVHQAAPARPPVRDPFVATAAARSGANRVSSVWNSRMWVSSASLCARNTSGRVSLVRARSPSIR